MNGTRRLRRGSYRLGRDLGDLEAVERAVSTRSATPIVRREVRRVAYRQTNRTLRRTLRMFGL